MRKFKRDWISSDKQVFEAGLQKNEKIISKFNETILNYEKLTGCKVDIRAVLNLVSIPKTKANSKVALSIVEVSNSFKLSLSQARQLIELREQVDDLF